MRSPISRLSLKICLEAKSVEMEAKTKRLCNWLYVIVNPTSYEDLQTVPGMAEPCVTFLEACLLQGLLKDDNEW